MSSNRSCNLNRRPFAISSALTRNGAVSPTIFPFSNTSSNSTPPSPAPCALQHRSSPSLLPLPSNPHGTQTVPASSTTNKETSTAGISRTVVRAVQASSTTPTAAVFTGSGRMAPSRVLRGITTTRTRGWIDRAILCSCRPLGEFTRTNRGYSTWRRGSFRLYSQSRFAWVCFCSSSHQRTIARRCRLSLHFSHTAVVLRGFFSSVGDVAATDDCSSLRRRFTGSLAPAVLVHPLVAHRNAGPCVSSPLDQKRFLFPLSSSHPTRCSKSPRFPSQARVHTRFSYAAATELTEIQIGSFALRSLVTFSFQGSFAQRSPEDLPQLQYIDVGFNAVSSGDCRYPFNGKHVSSSIRSNKKSKRSFVLQSGD